jgi:hypothetical protein
MNKRFLIVVSTVVSLSLFSAGVVSAAVEPDGLTGRPSFSPRASFEPKASGNSKSCLAIQDAVKTRSLSLVKMASNMMTKFNSIFLAVEDFYASKVVPTGKTIGNYQTLVTDVQSKRTLVQTALNIAKTDAAAFSCQSDPKAQVLKFNQDMQAVKGALADFRTSIKNLIVAVHSVTDNAETSDSPRPSFSPKPSNSPRPFRSPGPNVNPL